MVLLCVIWFPTIKNTTKTNGENNKDGADENFSYNYGVEGDTDDENIIKIRKQQIKNFFAILMVSHGTPMILMGDEMFRTQKGNNNAYCQDNEISWYDWNYLRLHADVWRFCRELILFRKPTPRTQAPGVFYRKEQWQRPA